MPNQYDWPLEDDDEDDDAMDDLMDNLRTPQEPPPGSFMTWSNTASPTYQHREPTHCPKCRSTNIMLHRTNHTGVAVVDLIICLDCGNTVQLTRKEPELSPFHQYPFGRRLETD